MDDMRVTVPLIRLVTLAVRLGDGVETCPARGQDCFSERGLPSWMPDKSECANCWFHYIMRGE